MSVWDKISNATRVPRPDKAGDLLGMFGGGNKGGNGGGGKGGGLGSFGHWLVIATIVFLGWAVWSGAALAAVRQFEANLLSLVPVTAVTLVILALLGTLAGWTFMKFPQGHFLANYGRRLIWVSPAALVVGAAMVPIALGVVALTSQRAGELAASYLGVKPAANICSAAGLNEAAAPTAAASPASAPRR